MYVLKSTHDVWTNLAEWLNTPSEGSERRSLRNMKERARRQENSEQI